MHRIEPLNAALSALAIALASGSFILVASTSRSPSAGETAPTRERVVAADAARGARTPSAMRETSRLALPRKSPGERLARSLGMVVGVDPVTGALGLPTAADRAEIGRRAGFDSTFDRTDAGLSVLHRPDGSMTVDLQDRFQEFVTVQIAPDGQKTERCLQGPDVEAATCDNPAGALTTQAPPPAREER